MAKIKPRIAHDRRLCYKIDKRSSNVVTFVHQMIIQERRVTRSSESLAKDVRRHEREFQLDKLKPKGQVIYMDMQRIKKRRIITIVHH